MLKQRLKKYLPAAIVLGAIVLSVLIVTSRPSPTPRPPEEPAPVGIQAMRADTGSHEPRVVTQGRVQVRHHVDLVARVAGDIVAVTPLFNAGSRFSAGDLLMEIDQRDYRNALVQARAELANAEQQLAQERAQAEQARREWRDLGSEEANRLFLREPQLEAANARIEAARSAIAQAELNLQRTEIRAPFDGEMERAIAGLGQYVAPGTPLASISSTSDLEVEIALTREQLQSLGWSEWVGERIESPPAIQLSWQGPGGSAKVDGRLRSIGGVVRAESQLYPVYIDLQVDTSATGLPDVGQYVDVELRGAARDGSLWVPRTAIYERGQVLVIIDDQLEVRDVETLAQTPDEVLISGVQAGELVVRQRPLWVLPGQRVEPIFPDSP